MSKDKHLSGKRGNLLRFGLGARNWLLSQLTEEVELLFWKPPDG